MEGPMELKQSLSRTARLALVGFALALSACSGPAHKPLGADARASLGAVELVIAFPDPDLGAGYQRSQMAGAMGGGALWAILDSSVNASRAESAAALVKPLQALLSDSEVRDRASARARDSLAGSLRIGTARVVSGEEARQMTTVPQDSFVITIDHALDQYLMSYHLALDARLVRGGESGEELFRSRVLVRAPLVKGRLKPELNLPRWLESDGARIKLAYTQTLDRALKLVARDLAGEIKRVDLGGYPVGELPAFPGADDQRFMEMPDGTLTATVPEIP